MLSIKSRNLDLNLSYTKKKEEESFKMQFLLTSLLLAICLKSSSVLSSNQCWRKSYTREVKGTISGDCPSGYTKIGALCYPACKSGYHNVGGTCWEQCKDGYTDEGALCAINSKIIIYSQHLYIKNGKNVN